LKWIETIVVIFLVSQIIESAAILVFVIRTYTKAGPFECLTKKKGDRIVEK